MRTTLTAAALIAAALAAPIALAPTAAVAQGVGFSIGPDGARVGIRDRGPDRVIVRDRDYDRYDRRVVVRERRGRDCRVIVDRRINRFGERVVRRTRVCD